MAMTKKLYNLMDWAKIEAVTYAEEDQPKAVLGAHPVRGGQTLITAYKPDAAEVSVKVKGTRASVKMELADEDGYFAALLKNREPFEYELEILDKDGVRRTEKDPYSFPDSITKRDIQKFSSGIHYRVYEILGSHVMKMNGTEGVRFAVWAPNAIRVSVVGDFNNWDGRFHQMERLFDSGIFELFVPGVGEGEKYKFEIKLHSGQTIMKRDPYAVMMEDTDDAASIIYDLDSLPGADGAWLEERGEKQSEDAPIAIYEHGQTDFSRTDAKNIIKYVNEYGYSHVLVSAYFDPLYISPCDPKDMANFTDLLHKAGIAVLVRWSPATFSAADGGLSVYDGSCIYEDGDGKRSYVPGSDRKYFNLGRDGVKDYLLANAMFLLDVFHFDGIVVSDVARMLYLDYGKQEGGWTPNMYGGNENLDAIDFFRQLNLTLHKYSSDVLLISDDDTTFPGITSPTIEEGLGFDYKINHGWNRDVLGYLRQDPLGRSNHYNEICFPMIYQYNERFILPLNDIADIWNDMPGDRDEKFGNLKALISYFAVHPGKKLISVRASEVKDGDIKAVQTLTKDVFDFYNKNSALFSKENDSSGFEWINNISARENILVFSRRGARKDDLFVIVVNFANVPHKGYKIGVPKPGKYTEIFSSDAEKYNGFGFVNKNPVMSEESECDGRDNSIRVRVAPLSVAVYKYTPSK